MGFRRAVLNNLEFVSFILISAINEERRQQADQNSDQRAENGEPECRIPTRIGDGARLCYGLSLPHLVTRHASQPERSQGFIRQRAGHPQTVIALILCNCGAGFGSKYAIDLSTIIAFARESFLNCGDGLVT